jgi:hypothetical protein
MDLELHAVLSRQSTAEDGIGWRADLFRSNQYSGMILICRAVRSNNPTIQNPYQPYWQPRPLCPLTLSTFRTMSADGRSCFLLGTSPRSIVSALRVRVCTPKNKVDKVNDLRADFATKVDKVGGVFIFNGINNSVLPSPKVDNVDC